MVLQTMWPLPLSNRISLSSIKTLWNAVEMNTSLTGCQNDNSTRIFLLESKSDNLQYNTLVCWNKWIIDQVSDILTIISFSWFLVKFCAKIILMYSFINQKNKNITKKIMLGTSDPWSTSHSSQQHCEQAYHIVDCWIFELVDNREFQKL